jgi:5-(carboxyamino)imidazole ribonucleotide synthase
METNWTTKDLKIGIVGGGQLGRMFIQEAISLDLDISILDSDSEAPAKAIAKSFTQGSITDYQSVLEFGKTKDVITVEIENVSVEALEELEKMGKKVFPQPHVLKIIKDKGLQKQFYEEHQIPTAPFKLLEKNANLKDFIQNFPVVQKLRTGGYDGKGVHVLKSETDLKSAFHEASILEEHIPFDKEIAVIVARNESGETIAYPAVECEFNPTANLVEFLFAPANISNQLETDAQKIAKSIIEKLNMIGILAVEFFVTTTGTLLVNEIAPRPHNSGHHTIECNVTSQFEQHYRSILNLPLGSTAIVQPGAMINLLGEPGFSGPVKYDGLFESMKISGVHPHLYGKSITKPFRKMGHVTITGPNLEEVFKKTRTVQNLIKVIA